MFKYSTIYRITNKDKYRSANPFYYHIRTEENDSDYLFTESDMKDARLRALNNKEDLPNKQFVAVKEYDNSFLYGLVLGFLTTAFIYWLGKICVETLI
tara:strand:+ start:11678 stop:11971 length:294 start_codon:yes stop_codon:yes gene_type:complete